MAKPAVSNTVACGFDSHLGYFTKKGGARTVRIISKFHDYYDAIQREGQDLELVYHRVAREETVPKYPFPMLNEWYWGRSTLRPDGLVVGFCGKLYPIVRIPHYIASNLDHIYCYTADDVMQWVANNLRKKEYAEYAGLMPRRRRWQRTAATTRLAVEKFFAEVHTVRDRHEALFKQFNAPIWLADGARWKITKRHPRPIEINPCLREYEFYRVVDPYTAFQELAMYLGKQAQPEKPIPVIPDKVMIGVKGFNERSFRKDPGKTKPRRQK